MRRRGLRVFALVVVVVALAVLALGFKEIHVFNFDREGNGPLGLTLGLDLKGGSDLRYRADLPDDARVRFEEPVAEAELTELLSELDQPDANVSVREFAVSDLDFVERQTLELLEALGNLGALESFETGDDRVLVVFQPSPEVQAEDGETGEAPDEAGDETDTGATGLLELRVRAVLGVLGYAEATLISTGGLSFDIGELSLESAAKEALEKALDDRVAPIKSGDGFVFTGGALSLSFLDHVTEQALRQALTEERFVGAAIQVPDQTSFEIVGLTLDETSEDLLRGNLEVAFGTIVLFEANIVEPTQEQMRGVEDIIQRRVNALGTSEPIIQTLGSDQLLVQLPGIAGSTVDVTFRASPTALDIETVLFGLGHTGAAVEAIGDTSFVIRTEEPLFDIGTDPLQTALEILGAVSSFTVRTDSEVEVRYPARPTDLTIGTLVEGVLDRGFSVSQTGERSFTIRTDDALTTEAQDELRSALDFGGVGILTFETRGGIEEAKALIGGTAQLEFKERQCLVSLAELQATSAAGLADPCSPIELGGQGRFVDKDLGLTGEDLDRAALARDPTTNAPLVRIRFNSRGRGIFREVTRRIAGDETQRIAIFLDEQQVSAPVVRSPILDGNAVIEGGFTTETAETLAIQLESGRLPVPLKLIRERSVDALLGADSLRKSLIAGVVGLGLVVVFMILYYRMAGVVAATSLIVYAVIVLAVIKLLPVTLILSGIAGAVLSVGMAVDANILIFERMKEEMRTGRTLTSAMDVGFRRAWPAIRDSNISTIITCLILLWFGSRTGTPVISGFAITLLIGVSVSMFTALVVSRNMLRVVALTPVGKRLELFTPEPRRPRASGVSGGSK